MRKPSRGVGVFTNFSQMGHYSDLNYKIDGKVKSLKFHKISGGAPRKFANADFLYYFYFKER
jgi:hypothetical protein